MQNPFELLNERLNKIEEMLTIIMSEISDKDDVKIIHTEEKMSISELCEYLHITRTTAHNLRVRGVIPFYGTGKLTYFKRSEVDEALRSVPKSKRKSKF